MYALTRCAMTGSIDLENLYVYFPVDGGAVKAVDGINLSIAHLVKAYI